MTKKILLALLLACSAPMIRSDGASDDEIEELRLQRERSEKAAPYLHENEAAIQKFTGKDFQHSINDPALQKAIQDDKASFEQRQQEIENLPDQ